MTGGSGEPSVVLPRMLLFPRELIFPLDTVATPVTLLKITLLLIITLQAAPEDTTPFPPVSLMVQRLTVTLVVTPPETAVTPLLLFPANTQSSSTALTLSSARNPKRLSFRLLLLMFTAEPAGAFLACTAPAAQPRMVVFLMVRP